MTERETGPVITCSTRKDRKMRKLLSLLILIALMAPNQSWGFTSFRGGGFRSSGFRSYRPPFSTRVNGATNQSMPRVTPSRSNSPSTTNNYQSSHATSSSFHWFPWFWIGTSAGHQGPKCNEKEKEKCNQ